MNQSVITAVVGVAIMVTPAMATPFDRGEWLDLVTRLTDDVERAGLSSSDVAFVAVLLLDSGVGEPSLEKRLRSLARADEDGVNRQIEYVSQGPGKAAELAPVTLDGYVCPPEIQRDGLRRPVTPGPDVERSTSLSYVDTLAACAATSKAEVVRSELIKTGTELRFQALDRAVLRARLRVVGLLSHYDPDEAVTQLRAIIVDTASILRVLPFILDNGEEIATVQGKLSLFIVARRAQAELGECSHGLRHLAQLRPRDLLRDVDGIEEPVVKLLVRTFILVASKP